MLLLFLLCLGTSSTRLLKNHGVLKFIVKNPIKMVKITHFYLEWRFTVNGLQVKCEVVGEASLKVDNLYHI